MKKIVFSLFILLIILPISYLSLCGQSIDSAKAEPQFINGEAQIIPALNKSSEWIKEELWVETSFDSDLDGLMDRMHVFVTRPKQTENGKLQLPVIYQSSPYYGLRLVDLMKETPKKYFWDVKQKLGTKQKLHKQLNTKRREKRPFQAMFEDKLWLPMGYITVYSSSPGTGLSDGAPTIGGENESLAPKAVIDWLCGRAKGYTSRKGNERVKAFWCSGKVGMTGTSYDGTLALAAASTGVKGLEAIIPIAPVSSFYHYYRSNGLVRSPGGYLGEDVDVLYDMIHTADKDRRASNNSRIRDSILLRKQDRITGDYNDFWESRDYLKNIDKVKAAMLIAHGFNDWNVMPEQTYRLLKAVQKKELPYQIFYHQRGHGGPPPIQLMNKWFTKYLHGVDNKVENDAKVWIVREGERKPTAYKSFPAENAENVTLHPQVGNPNLGKLTIAKSKNQKNESLIDDYSISGKQLATTTNSLNRLIYKTPILKKDIRISGEVKVTIELASSQQAANLSVWLVSLPWEDSKETKIYDNIITRGWADPQNYKSISKGETLQKGKFYSCSFNLNPDDQIVKKGQQIGLMIFSSDKQFTLHPPKGTELTIDLNNTFITLPIVGGQKAFEESTR